MKCYELLKVKWNCKLQQKHLHVYGATTLHTIPSQKARHKNVPKMSFSFFFFFFLETPPVQHAYNQKVLLSTIHQIL